MCGIVGVSSSIPVNQTIYDALTVLQHRGQDAAGIVTEAGKKIFFRKSNGLVRDVFQKEHMLGLKGNVGIGHVRYPTAGTQSISESQPFYVNSPYGLSLVHNGNLVNTEKLSIDLTDIDLRHLNTTSDSEVLLNVFASELQKLSGIEPLSQDTIFTAVSRTNARIKGAYAVIIMISGYGLLAFRDPNSIRPLVYGKKQSKDGFDYMIASESIALDALGFKLEDDVKPGEAILIDQSKNLHKQQCTKEIKHCPCIFEYIYLARPESVIDGVSVYKARALMGEKMAEQIISSEAHDIDVVIPIPDTSRNIALPLAKRLGVEYTEGFIKNRYIGRTFIMPGQETRRKNVRLKLSAVSEEFRNKNVLLVDDSIVRGTTSKEIVQMARDAGAKKVYLASAAPQVYYPNVYGIDMPCARELIAHNRSIKEISDIIGVDKLYYQSLESVYESINGGIRPEKGKKISRLEDSVFTGNYITGGLDPNYFSDIENSRNDGAKI